jgi:DNA-binding NarL/FixJ family response regulator
MDYVRLLVVDDSPVFLASAIAFIANLPRFLVVGNAGSGHDAIEQVQLLRPDLVLIDLTMPDLNGLELTRRIKANPNPPRVVIVTLHDLPRYQAAALAAGADAFLVKDEFSRSLETVIRQLFPT